MTESAVRFTCAVVILTAIAGIARGVRAEPPAPFSAETRASETLERDTAAQRAIDYLSQATARWYNEHHCFACHHHGDAARALWTAAGQGYPLDRDPLKQSIEWLQRPADWKHNGGEGEFNDETLAAIQFAFALVTAVEQQVIEDRTALQHAARMLAELQDPSGCWKLDDANSVGAATAYGTLLATAVAHDVLRSTNDERYRSHVSRADRWLATQRPQSVFTAATLLWAIGGGAEQASVHLDTALDLIGQGQSKDGGWGPYVNSAPEPFDTALVLLALERSRTHWADQERAPRVEALIARGRSYLTRTQQADGSWIETTRPPHGISYAQRVSTTGWATLALLRTSAAE